MNQHLFSAIILLSMSLSASAQRVMKVEKADGTVVEVPVTDVKRVFFEEEEPDAAVKAGLCPDNHHPHIIDLGFDVKWACCNVGAHSPEEYGDYFAWGETTPQTIYDWSTYKWCKGTDNTMTKYCTDSSYGTVDNKLTLELSYDGDNTDDAARANWGVPWRMPTIDEVYADSNGLLSCKDEWTTLNGVNGRKFTGPNGNSIFLPVAGYRFTGGPINVGFTGVYWSSTLYESEPDCAYIFGLGSGAADWGYFDRDGGISVRPVR